jgi:chromosomal replication initiation ATPase DnaA
MPDARQLPLELHPRPALSRDDLVVTKANRAAVELIDRWPDWPSPVTVLAGPSGAGKSHLAAIWRQASSATRVDPPRIGEEAIFAAGQGPILIDGLDMAFDEDGLFHLINAVRGAHTHLLVTSRRRPAAWPLRLPDLISRLRAATIVEIAEPDDLLLTAVITKLFADRQVQVEPHVVAYVAARIERSLATAISVVERLDHAAMEQKARITRALAASVISAMDEGQGELEL